MDNIVDFPYSTVATPPLPAATGITLSVSPGDGANFPAAPFDLLMWPPAINPKKSNAEIGRVISKAGDTFTINRQQYGTTAQAVAVGWQVAQPINKNLLKQLVGLSVPLAGSSLVLFGHSLAASGGATGNASTRGWQSLLAAMTRGSMWDQAVGGAVLARGAISRATTGWGGITQVLQGLVPNPYNGINWKGPWSSAVWYAPNDGVSLGGNWYRNDSGIGLLNQNPTGGNGWQQVTAGGVIGAAYLPVNRIPILWFGNNDIGNVYQANPQPFLTAMETALARACAAAYYDASSGMTAFAGGVFNNIASIVGAGSSLQSIPATTGATMTFNTPPDWPGGFVDFLFAITPAPTGTIAFSVDGVNTNVTNSGTGASNVVNFGNPGRNHVEATALSAPLAAGVAITSLPVNALPLAVNSGDTITVGAPGNTDTFVASAGAAVNAVAIPVTSHAPVNAHVLGDYVWDSTSNNFNWAISNVVTVRVPTAAGSHQVVATVDGTVGMANTYFNGVSLESPSAPPILVPSLAYMEDFQVYWHNKLINEISIDTWNTALQALVAQFPSATYLDVTQVIRPGAKLTTVLTAGQTGITSLAVTALPYDIAAGDKIDIGADYTKETATASGPASKGSLAIPINSFTSVNLHPVGRWVFDYNVVNPNFFDDGVHPSNVGHAVIAQTMLQALEDAIVNTPQNKLAYYNRIEGTPRVIQRIQGATLTVGTGVANGWGRVGSGSVPLLQIPADPGDLIELDINFILNPVAGLVTHMDVATWNQYSNLPIHYLSGSTYAGDAGTSGLGGDSVGAQASNGFTPWTLDGAANIYVPSIARVPYIVQTSDIINGTVSFVLYGLSGSTGTTSIINAAPNMMLWSAANVGPMSFVAEAA